MDERIENMATFYASWADRPAHLKSVEPHFVDRQLQNQWLASKVCYEAVKAYQVAAQLVDVIERETGR